MVVNFLLHGWDILRNTRCNFEWPLQIVLSVWGHIGGTHKRRHANPYLRISFYEILTIEYFLIFFFNKYKTKKLQEGLKLWHAC